MMNTRFRCAVIGGANIDIGGFPSGRVAMQDSNPGRVRLSAGGVGRNIACNLARPGVALEDCARAGVDCALAFTFPGEASSSYLFIADSGGDMQLAINDMAICDRLTPEVLRERLDALNAMDAVVLDANLPAETLSYLAENLRPPILADAVSTAKAPRLLGAMPRLAAVKPNAIEAETLTGIPVHGPDSAARAARRLVELGAKRAFITLGERGACCADASGTVFLPGGAVRLVNATGGGDAFTAALAWGLMRGLSLRECGAAGLAAASIAVESMETVSPDISAEAVQRRMCLPG